MHMLYHNLGLKLPLRKRTEENILCWAGFNSTFVTLLHHYDARSGLLK